MTKFNAAVTTDAPAVRAASIGPASFFRRTASMLATAVVVAATMCPSPANPEANQSSWSLDFPLSPDAMPPEPYRSNVITILNPSAVPPISLVF